jgi:hypothetical protein
VLIRLSRLHNQQALSSSIEEGLRMQAMHRCGGQEGGHAQQGWWGGPTGQDSSMVFAACKLLSLASGVLTTA